MHRTFSTIMKREKKALDSGLANQIREGDAMKMKALLVTSDDFYQRAAGRFIKETLGLILLTAQTVDEALEIARQQRLRVIVVDADCIDFKAIHDGVSGIGAHVPLMAFGKMVLRDEVYGAGFRLYWPKGGAPAHGEQYGLEELARQVNKLISNR